MQHTLVLRKSHEQGNLAGWGCKELTQLSDWVATADTIFHCVCECVCVCVCACMCACFLGSSAGKESACNAGDTGSIPGSGSSPGEGNSYPLQYSGLENSMDWGAWQAAVHGVIKSWTQLKQLSTLSKNIKRCRGFNINLNDYVFELNKKFINYFYL